MAFATRYLILVAIAFCISLFSAPARAQSSTSIFSVSSASTSTVQARIYPGNSKYAYYGCYNETTKINNTAGLRALRGGTSESLDIMTVPMCLKFCRGFEFAGLEYARFASPPSPAII
jgi:hypothetical protein